MSHSRTAAVIASRTQAWRAAWLLLALSAAGAALLASTTLAGYHELRHPPGNGDSSGSSNGSDGGSGGGSGCGGCGGD